MLITRGIISSKYINVIYLFLKILFIFREEGREGEKKINV